MIRVRASSLGDLFDCPARWEAKNILGMTMPGNPAATLGSAVHASTAAFDQAVLDSSPISIDESAGALVDYIAKPPEDVDWSDMSPRKAEQIGLSLHSLYCSEIAPTQNYAVVEITCEDIEIGDLGIKLTGTADRIYIDSRGRYGVADVKTGKRAVDAKGKAVTKYHGEQIAVYEVLAEHSFNQELKAPARIIGLKTQGKAAADVGRIMNARKHLVGDEHEPGLLKRAAKIINSGDFHGNPRSFLCSEKYCPRFSTCKFRIQS